MRVSARHIAVGGMALILALPLFVHAALFQGGEQINLASNETVRDNLYAVGGTVTSAAQVIGDLYAAGGTVLISGPVDRDLVAGGGSITITGAVGDDLRLGGGTVVVQGAVVGDVLVGGGQVHLAGSHIGGDVLVGGGVVRIDAPVGKNVRVSGGEVYLNAAVAGNVEVDADTLTLGPNTRIAGDLTYRAAREAVVEEGATVVGATLFEPRADKTGGNFLLAFFSFAAFMFLLMIAFGAFMFVLFFKRYAREVVENAFAGPLLELGRGLLVLVAMPVISVLLLVSIVGLPLGLLGLMLYVALLIFSWLMAPVLIGSLVYQWIYKGGYHVSWKTVLLGIGIFFIIGFVPIIGGLIQFGFMLLSLGSIARLKWHIAKSWR